MQAIWTWLTQNSDPVTAVTNLFSAVVVLFSIVVIYRQLKQMVREQHLNSILTIQSQLAAEEERKARKFVYFELPESAGDLTSENALRVRRVLQSMDYLGYLVRTKTIPADFVFDLYLEVIHNCWIKLKPYIEAEREKRGIPRFKSQFEYLARRCQDEAPKYYPSGQIPEFRHESYL